MKNVTRTTSNQKPDSIVSLGNGYYYYNYDIQSETSTDPDTNEEVAIYNFVQVRLSGKPNYTDCAKAIIRAHVTQEEEFDLINSHNYNQTQGSDDSEYREYLTLLQTIKNNIKSDFNLT